METQGKVAGALALAFVLIALLAALFMSGCDGSTPPHPPTELPAVWADAHGGTPMELEGAPMRRVRNTVLLHVWPWWSTPRDSFAAPPLQIAGLLVDVTAQHVVLQFGQHVADSTGPGWGPLLHVPLKAVAAGWKMAPGDTLPLWPAHPQPPRAIGGQDHPAALGPTPPTASPQRQRRRAGTAH